MTIKIIPIIDLLSAGQVPLIPANAAAPSGQTSDTRGRLLGDLRISVTDRCNFRCTYCMPKEVFGNDYQYLPRSELLSFGEITRTARRGARVIFRTAAEPSLLPGRVGDEILARWDYRVEASRAFTLQDRSSIYGGFHLYVLKE